MNRNRMIQEWQAKFDLCLEYIDKQLPKKQTVNQQLQQGAKQNQKQAKQTNQQLQQQQLLQHTSSTTMTSSCTQTMLFLYLQQCNNPLANAQSQSSPVQSPANFLDDKNFPSTSTGLAFPQVEDTSSGSSEEEIDEDT